MPKNIIKSGSFDGRVRIESFNPPVQTGRRPPEPKPGPLETVLKKKTDESRQPETMGVVERAEEEAGRILEEANELAEHILKEARDRADRMMKAAAEEGSRTGFEQGLEEGRKQADEEYAAAMKEDLEAFRLDMEEALGSVEKAKEACLKNYLEELKDCSVAIAEKVIHISLKSSGEIIKRMIVAETEKLKKTAWVKIYIDKSEYDMMAEADADVVSELSKLSDNIKFVVMEKENSGNCIIEMPEEIVDISVDTQLENIKELLANIRI